MTGQVALRKIWVGDAALLVAWRNENARFFPPQPELTEAAHHRWFRDVYERDPSEVMFIAEADGRPAGCLSLAVRGGAGEIGRVILGDKTLARTGVMSRALALLTGAYGLPRYWLRVLDGNDTAIGFYKRNGFTVTGRDGPFLVMGMRYRAEAAE